MWPTRPLPTLNAFGLHRAGSSENLELGDASAALARLLTGVDLITVTGEVGYITKRTFDRVLRHARDQGGCWIAAFVLRWVPYQRIAKVLTRYGLVTEQLSGHTFRQRRFAGKSERDYVLSELASLGIDPAGKETRGWHHSDFYLSCPAERRPASLREMLSEMPRLTCRIHRMIAAMFGVRSCVFGSPSIANGPTVHATRTTNAAQYRATAQPLIPDRAQPYAEMTLGLRMIQR